MSGENELKPSDAPILFLGNWYEALRNVAHKAHHLCDDSEEVMDGNHTVLVDKERFQDLCEALGAFGDDPHEGFQLMDEQKKITESVATPPGSEIVPEGTKNLLHRFANVAYNIKQTSTIPQEWRDRFGGLQAEADELFGHKAARKNNDGMEPRNPNLLFYEYEMDLRLAAKALEDSMPNAAERVRWLAGLLAKTKPVKNQAIDMGDLGDDHDSGGYRQ